MEADNFVYKFKNSYKYKLFKDVLYKKIENERNAKLILESNIGKLNQNHLLEIINLVDECYSREACHVMPGPWFGRMLKSNTKNLLNSDIKYINIWFCILSNSYIDLPERIDMLRKDPYRIKGLNIGFITLMLYLLDNTRNLIWLEEHHEGLRMLDPELTRFSGKGEQYNIYNNHAYNFAAKYSFKSVELDYVFSGIRYYIQ
jgi:hypothetical protein